jgi:TonB-dependent starch-binding outer membrane protein SusC
MIKSISYLLGGLVLIVGTIVPGKTFAQADSKTDSLVNLNPAVVVNNGYMTIGKSNLTGAVSIVKENRVKELAGISIDALLQGQAAGVRVVNTSGAPGAGAMTIIRGTSTLNAGTAPLYIIDGIPVKVSRFSSLAHNIDNNPLSDIAPQDIASISILKDGEGAALYGMRGANGVIVINTIGGTSGKTHLDVSATMGIMKFPETHSVFNADQYRAYILEKEQARGLTQVEIENGIGRYLLLSTPADQIERYNNNTDWQRQAVKTGMHNDYHLSLRGGDATARYSLNVGYTKLNGTIANTNFERFTTRFNLDYKVGTKLSFLNTLSYTRTDKLVSDEGDAFNSNPIVLNTLKSPTLAAFQQNDIGEDLRDVDSADYAGRNNPYAVINGLRNKTNTNRIMGKITGQYTISPYLNLRIAMAGDYYRLDETRFRPGAGFNPEREKIRSSAASKSYELMLLNENTLNYSRTFDAGKHAINATIGTAYQTTNQDAKTAVYINAPSDLFAGISSINFTGSASIPATDPNIDSVASSSPTWKLMSFFATTQYVYKGKYIVAANLRADGSSRFADNKRWGYFPSLAAAWRLSEESFLLGNKTISELKLRASYGISGNQEVGYYSSYNALVSAPYARYSALRIGILGNPDFQYERTKQFNIGFDAEFFGNRVGLTVDAYVKGTTHLLNTVKLPGTSGFDDYAVSEGRIRNKGIEITVNGKILDGAFGWETNLNIAFNKNRIISMPEKMLPVIDYGGFASIAGPGNSLGDFYGYNALGVYARTTDVNVTNGGNYNAGFNGGDMIFEDMDKDGVIDQDDRKVLGNVNPDWFGGFYNVFSYKGFDLSVFMDFAFGNEVFNAHRALRESMSNYDNQSTSINTRWRNEGDITAMPRLLHGDAVGNTRFSSRWIEDGSYVRFKALTIGYNLPLKGFLKSTFKNARISLTAQNLHTFSDYKGYSPETANVSNPIMYGVDYGNMPQLKTFLLGVKLGL